MASQENTSLCFVTWNINGRKHTHTNKEKLSDALELFRSFNADIVFMQETHVGPKCVTYFQPTKKQWKVFFSVHSTTSKGVAILIRNSVPFEYICHDVDCSGGYIVLFCRLYGEPYTLVNVYNHPQDYIVLTRLKEYLMETAEGVLVFGGDFNTVLDPSVDRKPNNTLKTNDLLHNILKDFTEALKITDAWSYKYPDPNSENRFTWKQGGSKEQSFEEQRSREKRSEELRSEEQSSEDQRTKEQRSRKQRSGEQRSSEEQTYSRIDMFFLPEDKMKQGIEINVRENKSISDHYPLVLNLTVQMQAERKPEEQRTEEQRSREQRSEEQSCEKQRSGEWKCSRVDVFFLPTDEMKQEFEIKVQENMSISDHYPLVLQLRVPLEEPSNVATRSNTSESSYNMRPGMISGAEILSAIKSLTDPKEHRPNEVNVKLCWILLTEKLKNKYNYTLKEEFSQVDNLIYAKILAKRLNAFISLEKKCTIGVIVIFDRSPQKIRWSFLKKIFQKAKSKYAKFAPVPVFSILDHLPETESSSDLRDLQSGCPLTNAILNLALRQLALNVKEKAECKTTVCYHKHSLIIHTQEGRQEKVFGLVEKFREDSGVILSYK